MRKFLASRARVSPRRELETRRHGWRVNSPPLRGKPGWISARGSISWSPERRHRGCPRSDEPRSSGARRGRAPCAAPSATAGRSRGSGLYRNNNFPEALRASSFPALQARGLPSAWHRRNFPRGWHPQNCHPQIFHLLSFLAKCARTAWNPPLRQARHFLDFLGRRVPSLPPSLLAPEWPSISGLPHLHPCPTVLFTSLHSPPSQTFFTTCRSPPLLFNLPRPSSPLIISVRSPSAKRPWSCLYSTLPTRL